MMTFIERIRDVLSGAELEDALARAGRVADTLKEDARRYRSDPVEELTSPREGRSE